MSLNILCSTPVVNMKFARASLQVRPPFRVWEARRLIYGPGGEGGGSQFPGLGVSQRKDMKYVNSELPLLYRPWD